MSQLGVELAGAVEGVEIVAAADVLAVDEDLRHAGAAVGARDHFLALRAVLDDVDVLVLDALALQQALRTRAVGAEHRAVDLNAGHRVSGRAARISVGRRSAGTNPLNVGSGRALSRKLPSASIGGSEAAGKGQGV